MGNTWVSNMLHSLDENGNLARQPGPACRGAVPSAGRRRTRRLAEHFGAIVEEVTARPRDEQDWTIPVPCRRRPLRKPCTGILVAGYAQDDPNVIVWECRACGDNGRISGWQETLWDKRKL